MPPVLYSTNIFLQINFTKEKQEDLTSNKLICYEGGSVYYLFHPTHDLMINTIMLQGIFTRKYRGK